MPEPLGSGNISWFTPLLVTIQLQSSGTTYFMYFVVVVFIYISCLFIMKYNIQCTKVRVSIPCVHSCQQKFIEAADNHVGDPRGPASKSAHAQFGQSDIAVVSFCLIFVDP